MNSSDKTNTTENDILNHKYDLIKDKVPLEVKNKSEKGKYRLSRSNLVS